VVSVILFNKKIFTFPNENNCVHYSKAHLRKFHISLSWAILSIVGNDCSFQLFHPASLNPLSSPIIHGVTYLPRIIFSNFNYVGGCLGYNMQSCLINIIYVPSLYITIIITFQGNNDVT